MSETKREEIARLQQEIKDREMRIIYLAIGGHLDEPATSIPAPGKESFAIELRKLRHP